MFLSLVSGSSGNASIIKFNNTTILIDSGMSGKKLCEALDSVDISINDIDAMLLTHEHIDHTRGTGVIARKYKIPIFATSGTFENLNCGVIPTECINVIDNKKEFEIGKIGIKPFSISHDANDPVGYSFMFENIKYSLATDTGIMTNEIFDEISGSMAVMLEANHDIEMLKYGEYPYSLKQRILSDIGHLSNDTAAKVAKRLVETGTKNIMLSHLSDKNNLPEIAYKTVENYLQKNGIKVGQDLELSVANRYEVTRFI